MSILIAGYRVTDILFTNDRTVVARAIKDTDGKSVIIKQLVDPYPLPGQLSRFTFSFEILSKFDHPNIVKPLSWMADKKCISDGKKTQLSEATKPTIVMEDDNAVDLFGYLQSFPDHKISLESFLDIAIQLAEALSVIHHSHVIHKDLHPGNILVTPDSGRIQITDFGLASLLSREQPILDAPDKLEGVLAYISPEQTGRMNRALDYRSDFYSLGATLYFLLAGHPPFQAEDALGMVHAHIAKQHESISQFRKDIPKILSKIIDKLLKKTAEERYQSAIGLKKDLEKLRIAISSNKPIPEFPLGMEDISDRFQVPQKLYGREKEVSLLMRRFFQAAGGKPKMLAIAGYSGIGKSALVHEIHKPIAAYNGLYCAGKFDQFQKNVPYSALQSALKSWVQHTLSLSEHKIEEKRHRLNEELGVNARVLVDFMPEFAIVLGELPEVTKLGADETQNRFHFVFQKFIKIITSERPLVLFIDDIQWADMGTLSLLPLLISEQGSRLLVIVAYRDNEVDENHPAITTLNQIDKNSTTSDVLSRLKLGPLSPDQLSMLLQDALHRPESEVEQLVKLIHTKTAGNPFFIGEFLKTLYTEGLLNFDLAKQRWIWDVIKIEAKGITDNVVDLMLDKMAQLPAATRSLIQLAACVGSRFDMEMLAKVSELSLITVTQQLWPALRDGLLLQDGGDWYLGILQQTLEDQTDKLPTESVLSQSSPMSPQCRFLHDRMLQAAYQSMSGKKRQYTHLRVGRLLLKHIDENCTDNDCFAAVEQLNNARLLLTDFDETEQLIQLNLRAAQQAKKASVWEAAARYAAIGIELIGDLIWDTHFEIGSQLIHIQAECEYLSGNHQLSDELYSELLDHVDDDLFKADICANRLIQSIGRGEWVKGVSYGRLGLQYLEQEIPDDNQLHEALDAELESFKATSNSGLIKANELPEMTDNNLLVAMKIYPNLTATGMILGNYEFSDYCTIKGCNVILQSGKSDLAAIQLACYAQYLHRHNFLELAFKQGVQAKLLTQQYSPCREISNCYNMIASVIWYLKAPYSECIELTQKGKQYGFEGGEIARALINQCNTLLLRLSKGDELALVREETSATQDLLLKKSAFFPAVRIIYQFVNALISGDEKSKLALNDKLFTTDELNRIKPSFHYPYLIHSRSFLSFWYGDEEQALELSLNTQRLFHAIPMHCFSKDHIFLLGLLLIRRLEILEENEVRLLKDCEQKLHELAELSQSNFSHKYLLFMARLAEKEKLSTDEICDYYRRAIESAKGSGFIQYQALACEYFAEFWNKKGFFELASPYYRSAMYLYRRWGCTVKINALKEKYDYLATNTEQSAQGSETYSGGIEQDQRLTLDMASVMKSAQMISSELQVKKLSEKVLNVIVECAAATYAALIIQRKKEIRIEVITDSNQRVRVPDPPEILEESEALPVNIIQYVLHSGELVRVGDMLSDRAFQNDPYIITNQPRSVLCLPVRYRDETIGALYLENNLTINAFTRERLDVINLLIAQAAISFENAQLFDEVNQLNLTLEQKVDQRTQELNNAITKLEAVNKELKAFSYSVSHDLRAPLRSIKGFSNAVLEDYGDTMETDAKDMLTRTVKSAEVMGNLINGLLELSKIQQHEVRKKAVNLSSMVLELFDQMRERFPDQQVESECAPDCYVMADERMMYSAMENLINNAWKYSSKEHLAYIKFGFIEFDGQDLPDGVGDKPQTIKVGDRIYYIKDNGAGFDLKAANGLFGSFNRLHSDKQFSGTGIGLATVKRIFEKHGGNIWANAKLNEGAQFYFSIPSELDTSEMPSSEPQQEKN